MAAYYNELDAFAAQWLRNLIAAGHIAAGDVDERSIIDVRHADLAGYTQCHFFAGIGVWSHALRGAGWSDDRPVWTGSCPCQPFSAAGKGDEFADERHLWPAWFELIRERRPVAVFGEQVASKDALAWLDHVCADLESAGYAIGAVDTCAAGFGAPHIRQRLHFVAHAGYGDRTARPSRSQQQGSPSIGKRFAGHGATDKLGVALGAGLEGFTGHGDVGHQPGRLDAGAAGSATATGPLGGFWHAADWLPCSDGKARPVEPGTFPLVNGAPTRVGRLRAYGNAICAPVAMEFVRAFMETA